MKRYYVVDTRVYEVVAPSEAQAIATVEDDPDQSTVHHTTWARPAVLAEVPESRPLLRVVG